MFCKQCGTELSEGAVFCKNCGTPVKENLGEQGKESQLGTAYSDDKQDTDAKASVNTALNSNTAKVNLLLKNPRFLLCVAAFVLMFFSWSNNNISSSVDLSDFGLGVTEVFSGAILPGSGFFVLILSALGYLSIAFPIIGIVMELIPNKFEYLKLYYIFGPLVSILGMVVCLGRIKKIMSWGSVNYGIGEVISEAGITFAFWLEIAVLIAIMVYTITREYGVSRESIREKGVKSSVADVANQIKTESNRIVESVKPIEKADHNKASENNMKRFCTNCGSPVDEGHAFCPSCGQKMN